MKLVGWRGWLAVITLVACGDAVDPKPLIIDVSKGSMRENATEDAGAPASDAAAPH